jgi:hypothetical protein
VPDAFCVLEQGETDKTLHTAMGIIRHSQQHKPSVIELIFDIAGREVRRHNRQVGGGQ